MWVRIPPSAPNIMPPPMDTGQWLLTTGKSVRVVPGVPNFKGVRTMDANKLLKLSTIDYTIQPSCGLCIYSKFPNNDWGTCSRHVYDHLKHDGTHNLSIHRLGNCSKFTFSKEKAEGMEHYDQFIIKGV